MNQKTISKCLEIANAICAENKSDLQKSNHVAILVRKNKIIRIGWNKNRTHPRTKLFPYLGREGKKIEVGIHAELDVIMKASKIDLRACEIIVIRIDKKGKIANSKPCNGCQGVINYFDLKKTYFTNAGGEVECF